MLMLIALLVGALLAAGVWLLLGRHLVRVVLGVVVLGHGANLLVFAMGRMGTIAPLVPAGATAPPAEHADPLPQALVLTAIVIGLGVQAFALALVRRVWSSWGVADGDDLTDADGLVPPAEQPAAERRPAVAEKLREVA